MIRCKSLPPLSPLSVYLSVSTRRVSRRYAAVLGRTASTAVVVAIFRFYSLLSQSGAMWAGAWWASVR